MLSGNGSSRRRARAPFPLRRRSRPRRAEIFRKISGKIPPEIEIEKDIEKEIETEKEKDTDTDAQRKKDGGNRARGALVVALPLNDGSEFGVYEDRAAQWQSLYPATDVAQELRGMRGWLMANPTRRKTRGGVERFINSWLSRAQDKGGRLPPGQSWGRGGRRDNTPEPPPGPEDQVKQHWELLLCQLKMGRPPKAVYEALPVGSALRRAIDRMGGPEALRVVEESVGPDGAPRRSVRYDGPGFRRAYGEILRER